MPWSDLLQLQVVRKVATIIGKRWGLGVGYIDVGAREVRPPRAISSLPKALCQVVQDRGAGEKACQATAYEVLRTLMESSREERVVATPITVVCHAGLTEVVAPIVLDGQVFGALTAGGFFTEGAEPRDQTLSFLDHRVAPLALSPDDYAAARDVHPWLSVAESDFMCELLGAAAEEVVAYHGETLARHRKAGDIQSAFATRYSYGGIIGKSAPMQALYSVLDRIVQSSSTVLVQGENGTGKELVARAIHYNSDRKNRRFVVTNCSAFNDNLLDSELFGHVRGAFTGAVTDKAGLFQVADKGTFFLDEIGDMSPSLQVKVLRVLQEGTFTPVGSTEQQHVDVRIIAATNRHLTDMVAAGTFRQDLYYRINVIELEVPPLRSRTDDIPLLVEHFMKKHARGSRLKTKRLSSETQERLLGYDWPGNVRELENEVERLLVLAGDERVIDEPLLSARIRRHTPVEPVEPVDGPRSLPEAVRSLERRMILEALLRNKWNKTRASADLKISRRNLIRLVQKYELEAERV